MLYVEHRAQDKGVPSDLFTTGALLRQGSTSSPSSQSSTVHAPSLEPELATQQELARVTPKAWSSAMGASQLCLLLWATCSGDAVMSVQLARGPERRRKVPGLSLQPQLSPAAPTHPGFSLQEKKKPFRVNFLYLLSGPVQRSLKATEPLSMLTGRMT